MIQSVLADYESSGVECPTCHRDGFKSRLGVKQHHSKVHGVSLAGVECECDWCGATLRKKQNLLDSQDNVFCDADCQGEWLAENNAGEDHHQYKERVVVECDWCGETFERLPSKLSRAENHYCSTACHGKGEFGTNTGDDHPNWGGGKGTTECAQCGAELTMKRYRIKKFENNFCDHGCYGDWISRNLSGSNSPHWAGGGTITRALRRVIRGTRWRTASAAVREESDGCYFCGDQDPKKLDGHHIVPVLAGGVHEDELLMSLCPSCHRTVEAFTQERIERPIADIIREESGHAPARSGRGQHA